MYVEVIPNREAIAVMQDTEGRPLEAATTEELQDLLRKKVEAIRDKATARAEERLKRLERFMPPVERIGRPPRQLWTSQPLDLSPHPLRESDD